MNLINTSTLQPVLSIKKEFNNRGGVINNESLRPLRLVNIPIFNKKFNSQTKPFLNSAYSSELFYYPPILNIYENIIMIGKCIRNITDAYIK